MLMVQSKCKLIFLLVWPSCEQLPHLFCRSRCHRSFLTGSMSCIALHPSTQSLPLVFPGKWAYYCVSRHTHRHFVLLVLVFKLAHILQASQELNAFLTCCIIPPITAHSQSTTCVCTICLLLIWNCSLCTITVTFTAMPSKLSLHAPYTYLNLISWVCKLSHC